MAPSHRLDIRVYYEDTDFSGYVYHASYLRFMERGRTEFLRAAGISNSSLFAEEDGLALVVSRLSLNYLRPAAMDDELVVVTALVEARGAVLNILVEAKVLIAAVRHGRVARLPVRLRAALGAASSRFEGEAT